MESNRSTPNSLVPCSSDQTIRFLADFHPTIWGDYFIENYPLPSNLQESEACTIARIEELKERVENLLKTTNDHSQRMELIDALQRLGVAYHFEKEIDQILSQIYNSQIESDDLRIVALRFRLLRQHGYNTSANVFIKFKEVDGCFKTTLRNDVKSLLSLYEATYLGTQEEDILGEALNFTKGYLKSIESQTISPLTSQVSDALEIPLCRRMKRLEAKNYISIYQEDEGQLDTVLKLAKLDFHMLQSIHREEIRSISMWWKALGLAKKLTFCRNRVVEGYFWALGVCYEPQYSRARIYLTKIIALLAINDDIYDAYGTLEELRALTEVIQRSKKDQGLVWKKLDGGMKVTYMPPLKEYYLSVSTISVGIASLSCTCFVGMGEEATKEAFDWVTSFPKIIQATSSIFRLLNDVVTNEFEQERNHVSSAVQCYTKEHGTSVQEACEQLLEMIEEEWKILNKECLSTTAIPRSLIMPIVNLARTIETMYRKFDSYTHASTTMKDRIASLLVEPISSLRRQQ